SWQLLVRRGRNLRRTLRGPVRDQPTLMANVPDAGQIHEEVLGLDLDALARLQGKDELDLVPMRVRDLHPGVGRGRVGNDGDVAGKPLLVRRAVLEDAAADLPGLRQILPSDGRRDKARRDST